MSVVRITIKALRCTCDLPECPGKGKSWIAEGSTPPRKCNWCRRVTWNGQPDRRQKPKKTEAQVREYNRKKQQESRKRKKKVSANVDR